MCPGRVPRWQPWSRPWEMGPATHLHALQQPRERLLPRQRVHVLLRVDDADLTLQLGNDGTCAPAVPQHEILGGRVEDKAQPQLGGTLPGPEAQSCPPHRQVTVEVISEVEHTGATPFCQTQEVKQVSLGTGGDTAEPSGPKGLPCCQKHAWFSPVSARPFRPDAGLPFPVACCLLWALALATSASHSGRGSPAAGRSPVGLARCPCASRVSPPQGLTPTPGEGPSPLCGK